MTDSNEKELAIPLPGEWILKKTFGPVLDQIGEDIKYLYISGKDRLIYAAYKKITNKKDGKRPNLRVVRDVLWNGSFTDESICAEYFGGILASSRSGDGKDDSGVFYLDIIKSLSSRQLLLHYMIYTALNKVLNANSAKKNLNPAQGSEVKSEKIFLLVVEILGYVGVDYFNRDLHAIRSKGIISSFQTYTNKLSDSNIVQHIEVAPSPLGIQLYAVSHNKLNDWSKFSTTVFDEFDDIEALKFYGQTIQELLDNAGIKDTIISTEK